MVEAGWYDDPTIPGGLRYWDGTQWTEHAQAPPAPLPGSSGPVGSPTTVMNTPPAIGPAPEWQPPMYGQPVQRSGPGIPEVGDWIKRSFSMVFERFVPLLLLFLPQMAIGALAYFLIHLALRDAVITSNGDFLGFGLGLITLAVVLFVVAAVVGTVTSLAGHHSLYAGHIGQPATAGQSFSAGIRSFPRYFGIVLLIQLATFLALGVLFGLGAGTVALLGENAAGLLILLIVVAYFGLFVASIWLSVKLGFIRVGAVVIPRGTSVIKTSWNITNGHFWGIFGRQLLLGFILSMIGMVIYVTMYLASIAFIFSTIGFQEDGTVTLNGQDVETLEFFAFSDVLPNPIAVVAVFSIISALVYLIQAVGHSGTVALYADLQGPNTFGHGHRYEAQDW